MVRLAFSDAEWRKIFQPGFFHTISSLFSLILIGLICDVKSITKTSGLISDTGDLDNISASQRSNSIIQLRGIYFEKPNVLVGQLGFH